MAQAPGLSVSRSAPQGTGWRFQATFPLRCRGRPSPSLPLALQTPVSGPYTCFALQTPLWTAFSAGGALATLRSVASDRSSWEEVTVPQPHRHDLWVMVRPQQLEAVPHWCRGWRPWAVPLRQPMPAQAGLPGTAQWPGLLGVRPSSSPTHLCSCSVCGLPLVRILMGTSQLRLCRWPGCCHQASQTQRLKQHMVSPSWRLEVKTQVWAGLVPPEASLLGV